MYNEEIKTRFLESVENEISCVKIKRIFVSTEQCESKSGRDICEFDRPTALKIAESLSSYDVQAINTTVSYLKSYARWCYDNGFFPGAYYGILGISAKDVSPLRAIRESIAPSEKYLFTELATVTPQHDGYIETVAAVFAWLGVPEPMEIRESDVFIEGRKIMWNGSVIVDGFSDFIYDFLTEYKHLKTSTRENGNTVYPVIRDDSYDTFIKQFVSVDSKRLGKKVDGRMVQTALSRANTKYVENGGNPIFSYKNIMRSGSLARLYEAEQNGLNVFDKENAGIVESYFWKYSYRNIVWLYKHYKMEFTL